MIRFQVPGSEHEAAYVRTVIRGLAARPSLQSQISSLQLMDYPTISPLHLKLRQVSSIHESLWNQRARGRRGGRCGRGRGRGRGQSLHDTNPGVKTEDPPRGRG